MLIEYIQSLISLYPYELEDNCLKFNQINKDAYNYLQSNINKYNIYDDEIEILFYKNKFYRINIQNNPCDMRNNSVTEL